MIKCLLKRFTEYIWWPLLAGLDSLAKMLGACGDYLLRRVECIHEWFIDARTIVVEALNSGNPLDFVAAFIIWVSTICLVGTAVAGIIVHIIR